jgi:hypothetical protein
MHTRPREFAIRCGREGRRTRQAADETNKVRAVQAASLQADPDPGKPGPWPVGVKTVTVAITGGNITVEVWYPAKIGSDAGKTPATYDLTAWLGPNRTQNVQVDMPFADLGGTAASGSELKSVLLVGGANDSVVPYSSDQTAYSSSVAAEKRIVGITAGNHQPIAPSPKSRTSSDFRMALRFIERSGAGLL